MISDLEFLMKRISPEPNTGCWLWTGAGYVHNAYGQFRRTRRAHRVAYETMVGQIPQNQCVCHRCDQPLCCNPSHLWIGTQQDNMRDMFSKGRAKIGRGHRPGHVISLADVKEIRALAASGMMHKTIATKFGISRPHISKVVSGSRGGAL